MIQKTIKLGMSIAVLVLLAACAGNQETTTLPDGTIAYRIDCGQGSGGLNFCFEKAGKSCGAHGYTIVTPDGRVISSTAAVSSERATRVRENQADRNSILVTCGEN